MNTESKIEKYRTLDAWTKVVDSLYLHISPSVFLCVEFAFTFMMIISMVALL